MRHWAIATLTALMVLAMSHACSAEITHTGLLRIESLPGAVHTTMDRVTAAGCTVHSVTPPSTLNCFCHTSIPSSLTTDPSLAISQAFPHISRDIIAKKPQPRPINSYGTVPIHTDSFGKVGSCEPLDMGRVDHLALVIDPTAVVTDVEIAARAAPACVVFITRRPGSIIAGLPHTVDLAAVAHRLAKMAGITAVTRETRATPANMFAARNIQGTADPAQSSVSATSPRPLSALGVDGAGVIVGCGDTGVDTKHCFFHDDVHPIQFNAPMPDHRKLVYYNTVKDAKDAAVDGHGTHVVGTIAGAPAAPGPGYVSRGVAPKARVYFFDLADTKADIYPPGNLYQDYFKAAWEAGATVQSSSWGGKFSTDVYSKANEVIDYAANDFRNMTIVFAAGNSQNSGATGGPTSIDFIGMSKSTLHVGAAASGEESFNELFCKNATFKPNAWPD